VANNPWIDFEGGSWEQEIDVREFIQKNYRPYLEGKEFLARPTERTSQLWAKCQRLLAEEQEKGGVLAVDCKTASQITSHRPGYIQKELELIVGLQTDQPLKRAVNPYGGIRMAKDACRAYGYELDHNLEEIFNTHRRTHNEGVFKVYTPEMKLARKVGLITGLPDAYGRGRVIGDYRRVALYGTDKLIEQKQRELNNCSNVPMTEKIIKLREELSDQISALKQLTEMAAEYGLDISRPADNAREAVQWLYMAYLGAIKEQNGAAMSLGRVSTFLDIYLERDLQRGLIDEEEAQELIDQLIIKLRMARQLRTPEYNELFAGDPMWITEAIGGMGVDGRTLVTKTSFRILHSLNNLGPAPEPNLTVLWSERLPEQFKKYCAEMSMTTNSLQYENDDVMRADYGDDYGIACCVSAMKLGKQTQLFGARCNLPKALLLALNGGRDEQTGEQIAPPMPLITGDILHYEEVMERFSLVQDWLTNLYVNTLNVIHYMHDKYAYERLQLALHDGNVERIMAFGIAGLSVVADSLSAIKHARVKPIRNQEGLIIDYITEGDYPMYGNDDDRVDLIAVQIVKEFSERLKRYQLHRDARPTLSILTITSNVVYGKKTGNTPDGRRAGEPFAPGANPMHGRDREGALAALNTVAKLPYSACGDGISNTFTVVPAALGKADEQRIRNLVGILDGYFGQNAHHLNVNVLNRETLLKAMEKPELYPQLTIRVSGYAVHFINLSREQQREVLARTFHLTA
jgi:formate C-acetyltransferase